jgi:phosphonate transport system substrate-binding protein
MRDYRKLVSLLAITLLATAYNPATHSKPQTDRCALGVFPFLSAQRLENIFAPIAAELGKAVDCEFRYKSAPNFRSFMDRLRQRQYEVAFVQPFDYVRLAATHGYIPLAAQNASLVSIVVVRQDSGFTTLADLKGKTIALPPAVAAVSYLTKVALEDAGLDPASDVKLVYTKNHGSCLQQVLIGKASACGTVETIMRLFEKNNDIAMKWVAQAPVIPQSLFVVRDDVPLEDQQRLKQQLVEMRASGDAGKMFSVDGNPRIFRAMQDSEYDIVRRYWQRFKPR